MAGSSQLVQIDVGPPIRQPKPEWLRAQAPVGDNFHNLKKLARGLGLHTVCESAQCPNIGECWNHRTATFMLLGDICTRRCGFCAVPKGKPESIDWDEPQRVAEAVATLGLKHGGYPGTPKPPLVAGREFTGVESATGRRVMGYTQWAAFAEKTAARPELLWTVPEGWSAEQAAAFPVNYFTAYFAFWEAGFFDSANHGKPKRVLIHAVAGGVGTAAVQIGKILGAEMYGTSSSEDKLARVRALGLQHSINYKERDYEEAIQDVTKGEGVDAVFEMLGGEHTAKSIRCLRDFGKVIQ